MNIITDLIAKYTDINTSLDVLMVVLFLTINLILGLYSSRGVTTIKEYAVGDKKFSTASLTATVIATCIGGGFFSSAITETYRQGLYFIIPAIGEPIALIIAGYFLVPRMVEFLHTLSVAEAMGDLYGNKVRLITAFCGICLCTGMVALQFKVSASVLQVFLGVNSFYAVVASAVIIVAYSSLGGIKSVAFTDILQFFTFCAIIPIISLIIWGTFDDPNKVFSMLSDNNLFNFSFVMSHPGDEKFLAAASLFIVYLFPEFQPVFFQRVVMASNAIQARRAFVIAGLIVIALFIVTVWVSILMLAESPNLDPNNLLPHMIKQYGYEGFKGLTAIGIMAIVMSTADSYINSAAILFSHDMYGVLSKKNHNAAVNNALRRSRIFALIVGIFAFVLAFAANSILDLLIITLTFYAPIVSVPLLVSLFGFRTTSKSVLISMSAATIAVIATLALNSPVEPIVPGVTANLVFLFISHYFFKQEGGWVGIKDDSALKEIRSQRKKILERFISSLKNFSLLNFIKSHRPKSEYTYTVVGIFSIVSVFSTIYSLNNDIRHANTQMIDFIYHSVIVASTILVSYPIWPPIFKNNNFIAIFWNIALPYILICVPAVLVMVSNFDQLHLMILMINLIAISMLLRWQVALLVISLSILVSIKYYSYYMGLSYSQIGLAVGLQFKITYTLLLFTSVLIAFIRPSQEAHTIAEEKAIDLWKKIRDMDIELRKAVELKTEFLNNINHEVRTPITGITSLGQVLWDNYDSLSEDKRKECIHTIAKSSDRLMALMNNILDLSALTSLKISLNLQDTNISKLVEERVTKCQKLYLEDKELEFELDISPNIYAKCDEYYISHTIDNLIINAVNYSKEQSVISIILEQKAGDLEFSILDKGLGIPQEELLDIFKPFTVGSRTKSRAGGRGIGLALCWSAIEAHNGKIWAESDGKSWAIFKFRLSSS